MIIRVSEIPDAGLQVEGVRDFPHPFENPAWALEELSLSVLRDKDDVLVQGHLRVRVPQTCGRCLESLPVDVTAQVDSRFCPRPLVRGEELELAPDDLEVDFYADDLLDLDRLIQTEAELGLPMKPVCRSDCRGLCPVCGGNRNVTPCACVERLPDPRLATLKDFAVRLSTGVSARTSTP